MAKLSELSMKVDIDVSEALTGLKAVQREAKEATKALKELDGMKFIGTFHKGEEVPANILSSGKAWFGVDCNIYLMENGKHFIQALGVVDPHWKPDNIG